MKNISSIGIFNKLFFITADRMAESRIKYNIGKKHILTLFTPLFSIPVTFNMVSVNYILV